MKPAPPVTKALPFTASSLADAPTAVPRRATQVRFSLDTADAIRILHQVSRKSR